MDADGRPAAPAEWAEGSNLHLNGGGASPAAVITDWPEAIDEDWQLLAQAPPEVRADANVVCQAMRDSNGQALRFASPELRSDREFLLGAAEEMGVAVLEHASDALRADRDFIMQVADFCSPTDVLWYVSEDVKNELLADKDFVLEAIQQVGADVLESVSPTLRGDKTFILAAAEFCLSLGEAVHYATDELKKEFYSDRHFMLQAVQQAGPEALEDASEDLRSDQAFMLAAAKHCGSLKEVLPYATDALRARLSGFGRPPGETPAVAAAAPLPPRPGGAAGSGGRPRAPIGAPPPQRPVPTPMAAGAAGSRGAIGAAPAGTVSGVPDAVAVAAAQPKRPPPGGRPSQQQRPPAQRPRPPTSAAVQHKALPQDQRPAFAGVPFAAPTGLSSAALSAKSAGASPSSVLFAGRAQLPPLPPGGGHPGTQPFIPLGPGVLPPPSFGLAPLPLQEHPPILGRGAAEASLPYALPLQVLGEKRIGVKVRRGPDWVWDNQDGGDGQMGTTENHSQEGWVQVRWDATGECGVYRVGLDGAFDLYEVLPEGTVPPVAAQHLAGTFACEAGGAAPDLLLAAAERPVPPWRRRLQQAAAGGPPFATATPDEPWLPAGPSTIEVQAGSPGDVAADPRKRPAQAAGLDSAGTPDAAAPWKQLRRRKARTPGGDAVASLATPEAAPGAAAAEAAAAAAEPEPAAQPDGPEPAQVTVTADEATALDDMLQLEVEEDAAAVAEGSPAALDEVMAEDAEDAEAVTPPAELEAGPEAEAEAEAEAEVVVIDADDDEEGDVAAEELGPAEAALAAVRQSGAKALAGVSMDLRGDREFMISVSRLSGDRCPLVEMLRYASEPLRAELYGDREFVLRAVEEAGASFLQNASRELRADLGFMMEAIACSSADAMQYAAEELRAELDEDEDGGDVDV